MRVTQNMLSNHIIQQIQSSYEQLNTYQDQITTGKKITKPSQDPVVAMMGVGYRIDVAQITQYQKNLNMGNTWLSNSDSELSQANDVMQRVRELTVEASNDSNTPSDRADIGAEIRQLKEQLVNIANTQVAGRYLFNGTNTNTAPVDNKTYTVKANSQPVSIEVGKGIKIPVNIDANSVFPQSLFEDLNGLQNSLTSGDSGQDLSSFLDKIDSHINEIVSGQADIGARQNRLDMTANRLDQQSVVAAQVMSDNENVDVAQATIDLNSAEAVNKAALEVGGQILQPSLLDFLK